MITHQRICVEFQAIFKNRFSNDLQKLNTFFIRKEYPIPPSTTIHHMVPGPFVIFSFLTWREYNLY